MEGQLAENNYKGFKKQKRVFNAFPNCYYISKLLIHLYSCFVIHFKTDFLIRSCSLFLQQMILELKAFHCISKIFSLSPCYTVLSFCYNIKLCPLFWNLWHVKWMSKRSQYAITSHTHVCICYPLLGSVYEHFKHFKVSL